MKWIHDHFDILHNFSNTHFQHAWLGGFVEFTLCSVRDCRCIQWRWNRKSLWIDDIDINNFSQNFEEKKEETRTALLAKKAKEYALEDYLADYVPSTGSVSNIIPDDEIDELPDDEIDELKDRITRLEICLQQVIKQLETPISWANEQQREM